jgi:hypothetical protein
MESEANMRKAAKSVEAPENTAEWTVMIYMAADNNLAADCVNALIKLQAVDTGNNINVIAQFDPGDPRISTRRLVINRPNKKNVIPALVSFKLGKLDDDRIYLKKGRVKFDDGGTAKNEVPHEDGVLETDTADPETLFDFISWSSQEFPAHRYMLILAGHSSGVEDGFLMKDEHPAEAMKLDGLKDVLTKVREKLKFKLDILGTDSCLMSMVEICFELRGLVNLLVGSQSMTPNPGWPYDEILRIMNERDGKIEAEELAPLMVHSYIRSYVEESINSGTSTDLSVLKIDGAEEVAARVRDLGESLGASLKTPSLLPFVKPALLLAHWECQSYNGELFVDLADFCELLHARLVAAGETAQGDIREALAVVMGHCEVLKTAIGTMVLESCFCGIDYQYSHGLSIYFPWSIIFFYYRNMAFAAQTGADWYRFLRHYIERTRRSPRFGTERDDNEISDQEDFSQEFELRDSDVFTRRVEPVDHGPGNLANSMRNPPRSLPRHMIKGCTILGDI